MIWFEDDDPVFQIRRHPTLASTFLVNAALGIATFILVFLVVFFLTGLGIL